VTLALDRLAVAIELGFWLGVRRKRHAGAS
jgi:hypothetical protein